MVNAGVGIKDDSEMCFEGSVPRLELKNMKMAYDYFWNRYIELHRMARSKESNYMQMLGHYFWIIKESIDRYKRSKKVSGKI